MKIFKDQFLNKEYSEKGYIKLKLLSDNDCKKLKRFSKKMVCGKSKSDFYSVPNLSSSEETSLLVSTFFRELLDEKINNFLVNDFELFTGSLLVKKPKSSSLSWHVDPSFYNQEKYVAPINIWAGIDKTTTTNGCFKVVPKSHKLSFDFEPFPLRDLGSNAKCSKAKNTYMQLIDKYAIDIPLKKGEVILHHQSLIHASHPNKSLFKKRIAFKLIYIYKYINKLEFAYFNKKNNTIDFYYVDKIECQKNISHYYNEAVAKEVLKNKKNVRRINLDNFKLPFTDLKEIEEIFKTINKKNKAQFKLT